MEPIALGDTELLTTILEEARLGLRTHARVFDPEGPAVQRLAFRELGLAIGLHAVKRMAAAADRGVFAGDADAREQLAAVRQYVPLAGVIEAFWLHEESRDQRTWTEHRDINEVMLATSLAPEGCLVLPPID